MAHERYVVMSAEQAHEAGHQDVWEPGDDYYQQDVLVDTGRDLVVWQDRDSSEAPEDMYLYRDLRVFVIELNRLAEEFRQYRDQEVP